MTDALTDPRECLTCFIYFTEQKHVHSFNQAAFRLARCLAVASRHVVDTVEVFVICGRATTMKLFTFSIIHSGHRHFLSIEI